MQFLDTIYSEGQEQQDEQTAQKDLKEGKRLNSVVSALKQAVALEDKMKFADFVEGLDGGNKEFFATVLEAEASNQDKAIVTSLLGKYTKLLTNATQLQAFLDHVSNLLDVNRLSEGAIKYLFERVAGKDIAEPKTPEEQQAGSEQPENEEGQPEAEEAEGGGGEEAGPQNADGSPQDSNNSEDDFYDAWEDEFNDTETELSEEDFSDLLDENELDEYLDVYSIRDEDYSTKFLAKKYLDNVFSASEDKEFAELPGVLKDLADAEGQPLDIDLMRRFKAAYEADKESGDLNNYSEAGKRKLKGWYDSTNVSLKDYDIDLAPYSSKERAVILGSATVGGIGGGMLGNYAVNKYYKKGIADNKALKQKFVLTNEENKAMEAFDKKMKRAKAFAITAGALGGVALGVAGSKAGIKQYRTSKFNKK